MKVLLLGKSNFLFWLEHLYDAFLSVDDVVVKKVATNKIGFPIDTYRGLLKAVNKDIAGKYMQGIIEKEIKSFDPDLVVVISPFILNSYILEVLGVVRKNCIKVGWVGDTFKKSPEKYVNCFDTLYFTDTGILEDSRKYGFRNSLYLPLAVNGKIFNINSKEFIRKNEAVFIGSATKRREESLLRYSRHNGIRVIGKKWKIDDSNIDIMKKNIGIKDVAQIYLKYDYVLNLQNEDNVINGLNMRTFESMACGSCLLQDNLKDIDLNFDRERELVVYNTIEELADKVNRLNKDRILLKKIQSSGHRQVLSKHTYKQRVDKILKDCM